MNSLSYLSIYLSEKKIQLQFDYCKLFFSAPEPKAQVHYCDHALSVVRPSVVRRR